MEAFMLLLQKSKENKWQRKKLKGRKSHGKQTGEYCHAEYTQGKSYGTRTQKVEILHSTKHEKIKKWFQGRKNRKPRFLKRNFGVFVFYWNKAEADEKVYFWFFLIDFAEEMNGIETNRKVLYRLSEVQNSVLIMGSIKIQRKVG